MGLRYLGFDQLPNARGYRFDLVEKDQATRRFVVTVDLALFRAHRVEIQEGPALCARKLTADLESAAPEPHILTTEDLRACADARAAHAADKLTSRKGGFRRPKNPESRPGFAWR